MRAQDLPTTQPYQALHVMTHALISGRGGALRLARFDQS